MPKRPSTIESTLEKSTLEDSICVPLRKKSRHVTFQLPSPKRAIEVGLLLVCGAGYDGQLGLGPKLRECRQPTLQHNKLQIVDIAAGGIHSLLLTNDGHVYSFGCNDEGALGRNCNNKDSEFYPYKVSLPCKVLKISAGDSHSACLLEDGRVFAWGSFRNSHGSMGLTLAGKQLFPMDIAPGLECYDIASGTDHLVLLTIYGKVLTLGCGDQGQLGRISQRSISGDGRRGTTELLQPNEVVVLRRHKPFEAIWATHYATFMRESSNGNIWAFGLNNYNQLSSKNDLPTLVVKPIITTLQNVKEIAGGEHHTLVLNDDGSCHVLGRCHYGRLGLGAINEDVLKLEPISLLNEKKIMSISCGMAQSFALSEDGQMYSWGMAAMNLGTGSTEDVLEPSLIACNETEDRNIIRFSSGGQHSIFLVQDLEDGSFEETDTSTNLGSEVERTDTSNNTDDEEEEVVVESEDI